MQQIATNTKEAHQLEEVTSQAHTQALVVDMNMTKIDLETVMGEEMMIGLDMGKRGNLTEIGMMTDMVKR